MAGVTQDDIGVRVMVVTGGAAGALTATGLPADALLIGVIRLNRDAATVATIDMDDLTPEFTITAVNTISNVGGTNTTGDKLLVIYQDISL